MSTYRQTQTTYRQTEDGKWEFIFVRPFDEELISHNFSNFYIGWMIALIFTGPSVAA